MPDENDWSPAPKQGDDALPVPAQPEVDWDQALSRAQSKLPTPSREAVRRRELKSEHLGKGLKYAFPILVIVFYALWRMLQPGDDPFSASHARIPQQTGPLTGVNLAAERQQALTRETEELLRRLERLAESQDWQTVRTVVRAEENQHLATQPVIQGIDLLAATRLGERSPAIDRQLTEVERVLSRSGARYQNLVTDVRAAIVDQRIARINSLDDIARETNQFVLLLGPAPASSYEVQVRQRLARRLEELGDAQFAAGQGILMNDAFKIREARMLYRSALQWIVAPDGWLLLTPLTPSDAAQIDRLREKIRRANRALHGPSLPMTNSDSFTWDGRRGSPVHDVPGGRIF